MSKGWAVASPHRSASAAAVRVFEQGGNAVDAALAAAVTLTVVYPNQCSVGGDVIALVGTKDGSVHAVDGSGRAPRALTPASLDSSPSAAMPVYGPFAITVPGAVSAWHHLAERWGSVPLAPTLLNASLLAADGIEVAPGLARDLSREEQRLQRDEGMRTMFVRDGEVLAEGATLRQPQLARTLAELAEGGADGFYRGPIGASIVRTLQRLGSPMTATDLADHTTSFGESCSTTYAGVDYVTAPPGSQGAFFLEGLAALELVRVALGRELDPLGEDAATVAAVLGAAARDRDTLLGDPAVVTVDVPALLSRRADDIARAVLDGRMPEATGTSPARPKASGDTVAIVAADSDGTWVSLIQSNFHAFGSGILDPGTGVVLHNRGASFSLVPDSPNLLVGGRRPAHTLMPVLVRRSGTLVGAHGTMGGRAQPQIHTQIALHLAGGSAPQEAVSRPRWVLGPMEAGGGDASSLDVIKVEQDVPRQAHEGLEGFGFALSVLPPGDDGAGHAQLVRSAAAGLVAATDPRADGAAFTG